MKVIKPDKVFFAMCVYKFTLDTGHYYYGATTNLGHRISCHVKSLNTIAKSKLMLDAILNAKWIRFEIVRFVNDRNKLKSAEEFYLKKHHVGKSKCLNRVDYCGAAFSKKEYNKKKLSLGEKIKIPVTQYDIEMNAIEKFNSIYAANKKTGIGSKEIKKVALGQRKMANGYIFKFG